MVFPLHEPPEPLQGKLDMPPRCAACPADMYADHALRLAQKIVAENFFLCLLRQKSKGVGKFRMVQNGSLAAGGKKIFFNLLRLGKLDKLLIHQIVKGNFPSLIIVRGGSTPCCRPLIAYQQRWARLSTTPQSGVHFIVD